MVELEDAPAEIESINLRLRISDDRMNNMETLIKENTELTKEIKEILDVGKTFFKIMKWVGVFFKWVSAVAAGIGVLWALWTHRT